MGLLKMMQKLHPDNVHAVGMGIGVVGVHLVDQAHQPLPWQRLSISVWHRVTLKRHPLSGGSFHLLPSVQAKPCRGYDTAGLGNKLNVGSTRPTSPVPRVLDVGTKLEGDLTHCQHAVLEPQSSRITPSPTLLSPVG